MFAQHPDELHQLFVSGVNAHDMNALMDLYENNSTTVDLEGHLLHSTEDLRAFLVGFLSVVKQLDGKTRRIIVADELALTSSTWSAVIATPDGQVLEATGTSTEVARRQADGTWRFVIDDPRFFD